jgi:GTP-dependent dephospho-CoA kinase
VNPLAGAAAASDLRPARRYLLPEAVRKDLGKPFGPVVSTDQLKDAIAGATAVIAVGDVVSLTLKHLGVEPALFVCDFMTQRGDPSPLYEMELGDWGAIAFRVRNPAASITREAWDAVRVGLTHPSGAGPVRIVVEGEEDLLGIPCFLEGPDGAVVLYGMPNQGVVVVRLEAALRAKVAAVLARFTRE